jgi:hypothetical protein
MDVRRTNGYLLTEQAAHESVDGLAEITRDFISAQRAGVGLMGMGHLIGLATHANTTISTRTTCATCAARTARTARTARLSERQDAVVLRGES